VDGVFFIVMDYIRGESLETTLDREKSLDVARAINYTVQVLKAWSTRTRRSPPS